MTDEFQPTRDYALQLDATDPLRQFREYFHIPKRKNDACKDVIYFCGNSLGLQPKAASTLLNEELQAWAELGVDGHFEAKRPWYPYHEIFRESGSALVGGKPGADEVVFMNSLTVNLHLMMATFYQPTSSRYKILIESPTFPSDRYAVATHARVRGVDADNVVLSVEQPSVESGQSWSDAIVETIEHQHDDIALVLMSGVNFFTGEVFDMQRITKVAQQYGCVVGFDLAHAAGNIELQLHDWNVDFACWCSYKYLNAGPGAIAGCFVHERHGKNLDLSRMAGWWGNDPETRFRMQLEPDFVPKVGADGWQLSNPPIFAMTPLRASLDLFDQAGHAALRQKSTKLTGYLRWLFEQQPRHVFEIITTPESSARGCQLSIRIKDRPRERFDEITKAGIIGDFRHPDVTRVAPVPLYNTFEDCWLFVQSIAAIES